LVGKLFRAMPESVALQPKLYVTFSVKDSSPEPDKWRAATSPAPSFGCTSRALNQRRKLRVGIKFIS
jgi:hypothetical protein